MTTESILSSKEVSILSAMITGGGHKRSADKAAAINRFYSLASDKGIAVVNAAQVLEAGSFEAAQKCLENALAGMNKTAAKISATSNLPPRKGKGKAAPKPKGEEPNHAQGTHAHDQHVEDKKVADAVGWVAHTGEDYTVVMRANEATDDASIRVYGDDAKELAERIAALLNGPVRKPRAGKDGGPNKRQIAADLLLRAEGCTAKDILEATEWPAVSVPAIARASGITLRQEKDGRTTRYFGTAK
jgi:hypothetical protein